MVLILRPIHTGAPMKTDHTTLTSRFKRYLNRQDLSERTVAGYMDDLRFFNEWFEEIQNKKIKHASKRKNDFNSKSWRKFL